MKVYGCVSLFLSSFYAPVFDMYVNAGNNAVYILQRLIISFGGNVQIDGIIGPKTVKATKTIYRNAGAYFLDAYSIARRNYYFKLANARPKWQKYVVTKSGKKGGWIKRAEAYLAPKWHLSPQEFQNKIGKWA